MQLLLLRLHRAFCLTLACSLCSLSGWFQWYCRFYMGRRCDDDERQIGRWSGVAGPKGRWKRALLNKVVSANARWDNAAISPVIRQTLLHWAFEITEADVLAHAK